MREYEDGMGNQFSIIRKGFGGDIVQFEQENPSLLTVTSRKPTTPKPTKQNILLGYKLERSSEKSARVNP
ncbi:7658_t:CDS:2, partial [Ambispora gerdemannii]